MKLKLKKATPKRVGSLVIESEKHDEFAYAEAECVKGGCDETLLTLSYEKAKSGYRFIYYLATAQPLEASLKAPLSREHFEAMLRSFLRLAQTVDREKLSMQRVCFDSRYIFYDPAHYALKFVYLPFRSRKPLRQGPLDAIAYVCETAVATDYRAQQLASRVLDYIRRCAIFSWIDFELLLKDCGVLEEPGGGNAREREGRDTLRVDCRDTFGYDFVSAQVASCRSDRSCGADNVAEWHLVRLSTGEYWVLGTGSMVLGRSAECAIVLDGIEGLSRRHALLTVEGAHCFVQDLDSTNGVGLNGAFIECDVPVALEPGDRLMFGSEVFELRRCLVGERMIR